MLRDKSQFRTSSTDLFSDALVVHPYPGTPGDHVINIVLGASGSAWLYDAWGKLLVKIPANKLTLSNGKPLQDWKTSIVRVRAFHSSTPEVELSSELNAFINSMYKADGLFIAPNMRWSINVTITTEATDNLSKIPSDKHDKDSACRNIPHSCSLLEWVAATITTPDSIHNIWEAPYISQIKRY